MVRRLLVLFFIRERAHLCNLNVENLMCLRSIPRCNKIVVVCMTCGLLTQFGCLSYSHCVYAKRAENARVLPQGIVARPGRIYFVSFPENCLAVSVLGWHPNVGHAALVTNDGKGLIKQYDYGWFVGPDNRCADRVIMRPISARLLQRHAKMRSLESMNARRWVSHA